MKLWPKATQGKKGLFWLQFQKDRVHHRREGVPCGRSRKLADHIFIHRQEAEKESRKWGESINPGAHFQWRTSSLKVPEPLQTAPPVGSRRSGKGACRGLLTDPTTNTVSKKHCSEATALLLSVYVLEFWNIPIREAGGGVGFNNCCFTANNQELSWWPRFRNAEAGQSLGDLYICHELLWDKWVSR